MCFQKNGRKDCSRAAHDHIYVLVCCYFHILTQITVRFHRRRLKRNLCASACVLQVASLPLVGANNSHLNPLQFRYKFKGNVFATKHQPKKRLYASYIKNLDSIWVNNCPSASQPQRVISGDFNYLRRINCTESFLRHFHFQCLSTCLRSCNSNIKEYESFLMLYDTMVYM